MVGSYREKCEKCHMFIKLICQSQREAEFIDDFQMENKFLHGYSKRLNFAYFFIKGRKTGMSF